VVGDSSATVLTTHGVGWLGAKRQLPLPSGKWVALSAQDEPLVRPSSGGNVPIPAEIVLTTVVFGQFTGQRLTSAMQFRFSAKLSPPVSWSGIYGCERSGSTKLQTPPALASGWRDECLSLGYEQAPLPTSTALWSIEMQKSLARLGATASGPALVSALSFREPRRGFLGVYRFDWPGVWLGDVGQTQDDWRANVQDSAKQAFAARLWDWVQQYQRVAGKGFNNGLRDDGQGMTDFSWVK
jgi:hypothetical protein